MLNLWSVLSFFYLKLMSFEYQQWAFVLISCLNKSHIKDLPNPNPKVWRWELEAHICAPEDPETLNPAFNVCFQSGSARNYCHVPKGPEWTVTRDHWPGTVRGEKIGRGDEKGQIHPDSFEVIFHISCSFFFVHIKAASSHPLSVVSRSLALLSMLIGMEL